MEPAPARRRGRPAKPTDHPVGSLLRASRERLGLTVREAARRAGLGPSSASYLSQLESGARVPSPDLARRLAEALGDDPRIYLAWSATARRSRPLETARAVRALAGLLRRPAHDPSPTPSPPDERPDATADLSPLPAATRPVPGPLVPALGPAAAEGAAGGAKLLVPELEEGADPVEGPGAPRPLAVHRVAPAALAPVEALQRPFAYRLSTAGVRRLRDVLAPGDVAVLTRRVWPPEAGAPCAVRLPGRVALARVLWNGRLLLLLPGPGDGDFLVLDAPDRTTLERLLVGRVVATLRPAG